MNKNSAKRPERQMVLRRLSDFLFVDDRSIQRILNEVDSGTLTVALSGTTQDVSVRFLKNMSARAAKMLAEDIHYMEPAKKEEDQKHQKKIVAIATCLQKHGEIFLVKTLQNKNDVGAKRVRKMVADVKTFAQKPLSGKPPSQCSAAELVCIMRALSETARREGMLSLGPIAQKTDDEYLKLGLQLIVDGVESETVEAILRIKKEALIEAYRRRLDVMLSGLLSIQEGEKPRLLEVRCNAFLP